MLVADTSALVSLAVTDVFELVLAEFDIHVPAHVVEELEEMVEYDDVHGNAATAVLQHLDTLTVHETVEPSHHSTRIDTGEASCLALEKCLEADFLLTDDFRALPELQAAASARVAISPLVLKALVHRGELTNKEATEHVEILANKRDWLDAPIYRHARRLFK